MSASMVAPGALPRSNSSHSSRSSSSMPPPSDYTQSSAPRKQKGCDCADCRVHENYEREYTDASGNRIRESNNDDMVLRVHQQPEAPAPKLKRSSTEGSHKSHKSSSSRSKQDPNITYTRDSQGNEVQEWNGSEAPAVKAHYDWDANAVQFPGEAPVLKRASTSHSEKSRRH